MNSQLTGAIRNVFEELADSAPPPDGLAGATLARARRQRIARLGLGGGLAAVLCAAMVGVVAAIVPAGDGAPDQAAGYRRTSVVTSYSGIRDVRVNDPSPAFNYSLLLNPTTGSYDRLPYSYARPDPAGDRVLVRRGDNSAAHPSQVGILNRASGDVRWIPDPDLEAANVWGYTDMGSWSPDGRQLLFTYRPRFGDQNGFLLVDAATLRTRLVALPDVATDNAQGLGLIWKPDGTGLAMTVSHSAGEAVPDQVTEIRFYDLNGRRVGSVPASASLVDATGISPDGSRLALVDRSRRASVVTIADAATGALQATVDPGRPAQLIGWVGDDHLLVRVYGDSAPEGAEQRDLLQVLDLTGQVVREIVPVDDEPQQTFIGSADPLPPGKDDLTF
ncbi:hypothetical protein ABNF97_21990 [Plantactinospora sp. B6F1]|uniref:hypothetical protein n=1 Tax=Plantactinospora sp. B6F1 TaxID=3158971 RepID=UPI0032D928F5